MRGRTRMTSPLLVTIGIELCGVWVIAVGFSFSAIGEDPATVRLATRPTAVAGYSVSAGKRGWAEHAVSRSAAAIQGVFISGRHSTTWRGIACLRRALATTCRLLS